MFGRSSALVNQKSPPGPRGLPIIGSLLNARSDPLKFALNLTYSYGDIASYKIGTFKGFFLNHPDFIKRVLQYNYQHYNKDNLNYKMLKPVLGEGLLTSYGDKWLQSRRAIQPIFHSKQIERFSTTTVNATEEALNNWSLNAKRGVVLNLSVELMHLTLKIVSGSLFSTDIGNDAEKVVQAFGPINEKVSLRFRSMYILPLWLPSPGNIKFKMARAKLNNVVNTIIAERQQQNVVKEDLLDMLLAANNETSERSLSNEMLRDEIMTLMLAGHETTAMLLTWTIYLLCRHSDVEMQLRKELNDVLGGKSPGVTDLPHLQFMDRVLQESMRLYPPVWIISRKACSTDEMGGYMIPKDTIITLSPYTMHRHPDFWPDPEVFDPDRFCQDQVANRPKYAYFPFGGGPHHCIGSDFALMEAKIILAMILQRFRMKLATSYPIMPEPLVTLRPGKEVKVNLSYA